jgi:ribosome-binding protein aMBF1 (putative translation factor)
MAVATMKHNAFHYLQKPVEREELSMVIKEAIREKGLLVDLETHLNSEVGRRIRGKRQDSQLTLKQLANRTGLSVSLISQIELGKSAASMSTLHKLATALGVPMTYFFETV